MSKARPGAQVRPKDKGSRGLVLVYTGDGKGKTTAALGLALRAVGRGWKVLMVQFVKGSWHYGELESVKRLAPDFEIVPLGLGFFKILDDQYSEADHRQAALKTLEFARAQMLGGEFDLVILDEINIALRSGLLTESEGLELLAQRPLEVSLLLTGRNALPSILELADLVTEMREIKHPYQKGILAQKGLDY